MTVRYKHNNMLLKLINNNNGNIRIIHTTLRLNYSLTWYNKLLLENKKPLQVC